MLVQMTKGTTASIIKGKSGQIRDIHFVRVSLRNLATELEVRIHQSNLWFYDIDESNLIND